MHRKLKLVDTDQLDQAATNALDLHDLVLYTVDYFTEQQVSTYKNKFPNIVAVLSNNVTRYDLPGVKFYGAPYWLANEARMFFRESYLIPNETRKTFLFNINKKQINRFLLIKLVEWFKFKNFCYTWSGIGDTADMQHIIREFDCVDESSPVLDSGLRSFLLSPITMPKNFIKVFSAQHHTDFAVVNYGTNLETWKSFVATMSYDSAVTLIAESVQYDHAMMFTEKTLHSVLGLTFPIWIGGYQQAMEWKKLGFDTFEDVIDHSYQHYGTLIERIYYAFVLNRDILSDLELASTLRARHMDRLLANRQLVLENQLSRAVIDCIQQMPTEIQDLIEKNQLFVT